MSDNILFEAYSKLVKLDQDFLSSIKLPEVLVVGVQSHGKSSLVEYFLGFPCTFVADGTGTRCPVKYIMHFGEHPEKKTGLCFVTRNNKQEWIPVFKLAHVIGSHMKYIEKTEASQFSDQEVIVEVWNARMNSVLIDLPGFVDADPEKNKRILAIIQKRTENPDCGLVLVLDSTQDWSTHSALGKLKSMEGDWRSRTIALLNKFDRKLSSLKDEDSIQKYLEVLPEDKALERVYVSLNASSWVRPSISEDSADEKSIQDYWVATKQHVGTTILHEETKMLTDWKASVKWNSDWDSFFGLGKAASLIQKTLMKSLEKTLPGLMKELDLYKTKLETDLKTNEAARAESDPEKMHQVFSSLIDDYAKTFTKLYNRDGSTFFDFPLDKFGMPVVTDKPTSWEYYHPLSEMLSKYQKEIVPDLQAEFQELHFGGAQLARLLKYFKFLVCAAEYKPFSMADLRSFEAGIWTNSSSNFEKAVLEATKVRLDGLFVHGFDWLRFEIESSLGHVHSMVKKKLGQQNPTATLTSAFDDAWKSALDEFLNQAMLLLKESVRSKISYIIYDLLWRMKLTEMFPHEKNIDAFPDPKADEVLAQMKKHFERDSSTNTLEQFVKFNMYPFPSFLSSYRPADSDLTAKYLNATAREQWACLKQLLIMETEFNCHYYITSRLLETGCMALTSKMRQIQPEEFIEIDPEAVVELEETGEMLTAQLKNLNEAMEILGKLSSRPIKPKSRLLPGVPHRLEKRMTLLKTALEKEGLDVKWHGDTGDSLPLALGSAVGSTKAEDVRREVCEYIATAAKYDPHSDPKDLDWIANDAARKAWVQRHNKSKQTCEKSFAIVFAKLHNMQLQFCELNKAKVERSTFFENEKTVVAVGLIDGVYVGIVDSKHV